MNRPRCVAFVLVLLVFHGLPPTSLAQTSGLTAGMWANYSVSGDLSEGVVSSEITVSGVAGSNVTVISVDTYFDGSKVNETLWLDLTTGIGRFEPGFYFAITPGLNAGQSIYQTRPLVVSARESREYAGVIRDVNYALNSTGGTSYYWDVESGIFAEILRTYVNSTTGQTRVGVHVNLTTTNIWTVSTPPPRDTWFFYTLAAMVGGFVVLALVLVARRLLLKRERKIV